MVGETHRRLAAIVLADVVGYSRLMGADETGTLSAMQGHRDELWDPTIEKYGGRVVNRAGDGALVEFGSAVAAMECAVAIQTSMADRNADVSEDKRVQLRVGVNIGEVIVDGDEIYGDGVNIAARLQTLAEPGGIALSGNVEEQVRGKLDLVLADDGEHEVKNIARPVRVWRWVGNAANSSHVRVADMSEQSLSAKPSIVVLPFDNMSGDTEQEYFADGITEDLITALSRFGQLVVLARNTSFTYKGRAVDIKTVARELDIRYALEGSVRKAGNRVRITAQLIEGDSGKHLWAERYDRDLEDIFDVQDEITEVVVGAIEPAITKAEFERVRRTPPDSLDAWAMHHHGLHHFNLFTADGDEEARRYFRAAIALDPSFSAPHASLARTYSRSVVSTLPENMDERYKLAASAAEKALSLDPDDAYAHVGLGFARHRTNPDVAIRAFEEALSINPNLAIAHFGIAVAYASNRQPEAVVSHLKIAMRLSPRDPLMDAFYRVMAIAQFILGDYEAAVDWSSKARSRQTYIGRAAAVQAAALALLGREGEMVRERDRVLNTAPHLTVSLACRISPELGDEYAEGLRKAGFPD